MYGNLVDTESMVSWLPYESLLKGNSIMYIYFIVELPACHIVSLNVQ